MIFAELSPVDEDQWTAALAHEVKRLQQRPEVISGSLGTFLSADGEFLIRFELETVVLIEQHETEIHDWETVGFVYAGLNAVGRDAPAVWAMRPDFPRHIGHVNPTNEKNAVSLCLARAGLQPTYDHLGIDGVLSRLNRWLLDAKTGGLMSDGWEPVPMPSDQNANIASFDLARFQELAQSEPSGGSARGIARSVMLNNDDQSKAVFLDVAIPSDDSELIQRARDHLCASSPSKSESSFPWVFVWGNKDTPQSQQLFERWNSLGEIVDGLAGTDLEGTFLIKIMEALEGLGPDSTKNAQSGRSYVLLIGVWRPVPLIEDVFGLATDDEARRLEIRAFLLQWGSENNPVDDRNSAHQLVCASLPSPELMAFTSGMQGLRPMGIIGYGALGSSIADFMARSGVRHLSVMDQDTLWPHNLARHSGNRSGVGRPKIGSAAALSSEIYGDPGSINCRISSADVCSLSAAELAEHFAGCGLIIDASADERVRQYLSETRLPDNARLCRIEIYARGKLGVAFHCGEQNNPNPVDLYYELIRSSADIDDVKAWLVADQGSAVFEDELLTGIGCASATTRMPKHVVAQHASAFMPDIIDANSSSSGSGFGVNPLNERMQPSGYLWIDVPPVTVMQPRNNEDWSVRLSDRSLRRIEQLREAAAPSETGGYLYGGIDYNTRQVYIVEVSDLPDGSKASPSSLKLAGAGHTVLERKLERCTGGKLSLVGTWHTHPASGPQMSTTDRETMEGFREDDKELGLPTLLIVSSRGGLASYLWF